MSRITTIASDILKAAAMQISIWRWEMHMIARYGLEWGYHPTYANVRGGSVEENDP